MNIDHIGFINVFWMNENPNMSEDEYETVMGEIRALLTTGEGDEAPIDVDPSSIVFHTIYIGDEFEGPAYLVYGKEGDSNNIFVDYIGYVEFEAFSS